MAVVRMGASAVSCSRAFMVWPKSAGDRQCVLCTIYVGNTYIPNKEARSGRRGMPRLTASSGQGLFAERGKLVHLVATETGSETLVDL